MMNMHDNHDRHDRFLVAALAAGDLEGRALTDAEELVDACADCAELLADIRTIAAATAALPLLPRPTDFRLSPDTAERLSARGWRGILVRLADTRFGFSRPLAVGLTTLGLVGVIAGSIPGAMGGAGSGGAPAQPANGNAYNVSEDQSGAPAGASAPPASAVPAPTAAVQREAGSAGPASSVPPAAPVYPVAGSSGSVTAMPPSPAPESTGGVAAAASPSAAKGVGGTSGDLLSLSSESSGPSPLLVGSFVLLLMGLGILGTQWVATKLTNRSSDQP
jgi:hypothetical protein